MTSNGRPGSASPTPGEPHSKGTSKATWTVKSGLAQMLKGGVIMDVVTADHARIAEEAGAVAVMALERVPADIRKEGGVARMSDPQLITEIMDSVTIDLRSLMTMCPFCSITTAFCLSRRTTARRTLHTFSGW